MLPKNKEARDLVENCLYSYDGNISTTLATLFENNSAGINYEAVHDNLLPIVRFASTQQIYCYTVLNGNERELPHAYSQIEAIINKLENHEKENTE